jgi:hypothetical protein
MAGLVPAIHVFAIQQVVDARDKRGHDEGRLHENQAARCTPPS